MGSCDVFPILEAHSREMVRYYCGPIDGLLAWIPMPSAEPNKNARD